MTDISRSADGLSVLEKYTSTRQHSLKLTENLSLEDMQVQSMPDASPIKWHLAHTSWAFETFILQPFAENYCIFKSQFEYLFNSYYNAIGEQFPRAKRGLLTRPDLSEVLSYRAHVDKAIIHLIKQHKDFEAKGNDVLFNRLILMINHEQQHQELMLTDLKHLFSQNPDWPEYADIEKLSDSTNSQFIEFPGGLYTIGHQNEAFYFDNEGPSHQYYLAPFKLQNTLVSNADYLEFLLDGGYQNPAYWLSEAWQKITQQQISSPLYWDLQNGEWFEYSMNGRVPLNTNSPVKHINYFEANAYANWKGKRLPTEQEWEVAARSNHPELQQMYSQLWQWTSSSYCAYPGFRPENGAIGEYNGKFMVNQYVLRGGSWATPQGHIRASYRNFFYPDASWQFSGIRLAENI